MPMGPSILNYSDIRALRKFMQTNIDMHDTGHGEIPDFECYSKPVIGAMIILEPGWLFYDGRMER